MNGIELHAVKDAESIKAVEKKKYQKKNTLWHYHLIIYVIYFYSF